MFDGISGIGVSNFGHGHPAITNSIHAQLDLNLHTMVYGEFVQDVQRQAAASLRASLPAHLDSVYFVNSGAEAVDAALKLAKRLTGRTKIMGVEGGYHGNTHGALSVSSNETRKAPFRPLLPEVSFLNWNDMADLAHIDANTAAVIVETVQGDAGIRIPDKLGSKPWPTPAENTEPCSSWTRSSAAWDARERPGHSASLRWFLTSCAWAKRWAVACRWARLPRARTG